MTKDVLREFVLETAEQLDQLDRDFLGLAQDPRSAETLRRVFRTMHAIKGTCGFLQFNTVATLAHTGEDLLVKLRDGSAVIDGEVAGALLALTHALRTHLAAIDATGQEGHAEDRSVIAMLQRLVARGATSPAQAQRAAEKALPEPAQSKALSQPAPSIVERQAVRVDPEALDHILMLIDKLADAGRQQVPLADPVAPHDVGTRNGEWLPVVAELRALVMSLRRQPIGDLWSGFPRMAHDVAVHCGKRVRLEMDGTDTVLDTTILNALRAPLLHLVRNCVDHGIELPSVRSARGKTPDGLIRLRAARTEKGTDIVVSDDGAGMDPSRLRARAQAGRFITAEQAASMPDIDVLRLVLLPGFSTAEEASAVSGRGVGMDIVQSTLERLGGDVRIQSNLGRGTTITLHIPAETTVAAQP